MVDPITAITAIGLAGNIAQFCQYAGMIVSKGNKIYKNVDGAFRENDDLEAVSRKLRTVTTSLSESLAERKQETYHGAEENDLLEISTACQQTAHELVTTLEAL